MTAMALAAMTQELSVMKQSLQTEVGSAAEIPRLSVLRRPIMSASTPLGPG